jgi:hypothetical protein
VDELKQKLRHTESRIDEGGNCEEGIGMWKLCEGRRIPMRVVPPFSGKPAFKPGQEHVVLDLVDDF